MIDWSANSKRKKGKDSIWICTGSRKGTSPPRNPPTRTEALEAARRDLRKNVEEGLVTLIGFDFPYGFPHGFAEATNAPGRAERGAWRSMWDLLSSRLIDGVDNKNNRFEVAEQLNVACGQSPGPFWNYPPSQTRTSLPRKSPRFPFSAAGFELKEYRHAEKSLRDRGRRVQEAWKLYTAGSVGSQALTGLPKLSALRDDSVLKQHSCVWPFETGFTRDPTLGRRAIVVHAEIWPGVTDFRPGPDEVKDAVQVRGLVEYFLSLDSEGRLGDLFERPTNLSDVAAEECVSEEGWILGAE